MPYDMPQATGGVAFGLTVVWGLPRSDANTREPEPSTLR
jgi:hypothetical protein